MSKKRAANLVVGDVVWHNGAAREVTRVTQERDAAGLRRYSVAATDALFVGYVPADYEYEIVTIPKPRVVTAWDTATGRWTVTVDAPDRVTIPGFARQP